MQPQDPHPHLTLFLTLWAAVGPLAGILIGHLLTRSWQSKQWLLDNKKQEYRELLSSLTESFGAISRYQSKISLISDDERKEINDAELKTLKIIQDRLFIAPLVEEANIELDFLTTTEYFKREDQFIEFTNRYEKIRNVVLSAALKEFGISEML